MSAFPAALVHQASIYASDEEFLATAVPFVRDGLDRGEPVLVTTTAANLDLLNDALGADASDVDYAESAYFGRRPALRVAAFHRYWRRTTTDGTEHVRILAEPIWTGRSERDITAWKRMEAGLNEVLADTNIWMICPYDARVLSPGFVSDALRTHPVQMAGETTTTCGEYVKPVDFAAALDATPLPGPPADAPTLRVPADPAALHGLRAFVATQAAAHELAEQRAAMLVLAVTETASYLTRLGAGELTVHAWTRPGSILCEVSHSTARIADPFLGFRPPDLASTEAGLWLARQVCDYVEVRANGSGTTVQLQVPSRRAEELIQSLVG